MGFWEFQEKVFGAIFLKIKMLFIMLTLIEIQGNKIGNSSNLLRKAAKYLREACKGMLTDALSSLYFAVAFFAALRDFNAT